MLIQKKKPGFQTILLSLCGFVLLWAVVTDAWGYSSHLAFGHGDYIYAYLSRLIWVAPALWLILRHGSFLRLGRETLFSWPVFNRSFAIVLAVSVLFPLIEMFVVHGGFWLNPSVNLPLEIVKFILVGFVEETVFRGWGYNALSSLGETAADRKAVICSTAFFI